MCIGVSQFDHPSTGIFAKVLNFLIRFIDYFVFSYNSLTSINKQPFSGKLSLCFVSMHVFCVSNSVHYLRGI